MRGGRLRSDLAPAGDWIRRAGVSRDHGGVGGAEGGFSQDTRGDSGDGGNAGGVGSTVAGIARVPFVVGIRSLSAGRVRGKYNPRWKTPYVSILCRRSCPGAILLLSQINNSTRSAYQILIDAAIILYFIPFLYNVRRRHKLRRGGSARISLQSNSGREGRAVASGGLGFLVVLAGILVFPVPPGDSTNKILFEVELLVGTAGSILLGLIRTGAGSE